MPINERERLKLYDALGNLLGSDDAGILMELLPPSGWDDIPTKDDVRAQGTALRGEMAEVRGEMAQVWGEIAKVRGEMSEFRGEMIERFGTLSLQIAGMQRNLFAANAVFVLTVWISLLVAR